MTMKNIKAVIKCGNKKSKPITIETGVKQGDSLSATLFIIALHIINNLTHNSTIFYKSVQIYAHADDICIIARNKRSLITCYEEMERKAETIGLIVNEKKTKYMVLSTSETRRSLQNIKILNKTFEGDTNFKYLGTLIINQNDMR